MVITGSHETVEVTDHLNSHESALANYGKFVIKSLYTGGGAKRQHKNISINNNGNKSRLLFLYVV